MDLLVIEVLAQFCARYPRLDIRMDILAVDGVLKEVAESGVHIGLAYNSPAHARVESRASAARPVVLLVRPGHPLAMRGGAGSIQDLLAYSLAMMPASFGAGHALSMVEFAENLSIRATLATR